MEPIYAIRGRAYACLCDQKLTAMVAWAWACVNGVLGTHVELLWGDVTLPRG